MKQTEETNKILLQSIKKHALSIVSVIQDMEESELFSGDRENLNDEFYDTLSYLWSDNETITKELNIIV